MRTLVLTLTLLLALMPAARADDRLSVIASFSILADMVKTIGGDDVKVTALVGPESDAHGYQPTPAVIRELGKAQLLVINGLEFEPWVARMLEASGYKNPVVTASQGVTPRKLDEDHDEHEGHDDHEEHHESGHHHGEGMFDPHAWQDIGNARIYAANIAAALARALPAKVDAINARAKAYDAELAKLDADIKTRINALPEDKRKIITGHDAFGYFSDAYDVEILAPQGINTQNEPSAADVAALIAQIKKERIKTVFVENLTNQRLSAQIAKDTGATLGTELYSDALSKQGGPASTYLDMMRHNADAIINAIRKDME